MALRPAWNSTSSSQLYLSRASYTSSSPLAAPASATAALIAIHSDSTEVWGKGDIGTQAQSSSLTETAKALYYQPHERFSSHTSSSFHTTATPNTPPSRLPYDSPNFSFFH